MKKLFFVLLFLAIMAAPVLAVNTEVTDTQTIMVTFDGSGNWTSLTNNPGGMFIYSIVIKPGAPGDNIVIRNKTNTGNILFPGKSTLGDPEVPYFPEKVPFKPLIVLADCTVSASATITIYLAPGY